MTRLIEAATANPSPINISRVLRYAYKHPMWACMATAAEIAAFNSFVGG